MGRILVAATMFVAMCAITVSVVASGAELDVRNTTANRAAAAPAAFASHSIEVYKSAD